MKYFLVFLLIKNLLCTVANNNMAVNAANGATEGDDENVADGQTLQMFQQQRLYHTMRLVEHLLFIKRVLFIECIKDYLMCQLGHEFFIIKQHIFH